MTLTEAAQRVTEDLGALATGVVAEADEVRVACEVAVIADVVRALRDGSVGFDFFTFMTAADYPPGSEHGGEAGCLDLFYHLRSTRNGVAALVATTAARDGESVRTVSDLYRGADWHERECYDLFGVVFAGHPNLTRILLPDSWRGFPLRKDYDESMEDLTYTPDKRWPEIAADREPEKLAWSPDAGKKKPAKEPEA